MKKTAHVDFNDGNLDNVRFVKVNSLPAVSQHITPMQYVYDSLDETSLVKNNQIFEFHNNNLTNIKSITLNPQAVNDDQGNTKANVDQFHQENEQSRKDLGIEFYDESTDSVKTSKPKISTTIKQQI